MKSEDIILKIAIMHILDTDGGELLLSDKPMEITPEIQDFLRLHIEKVTQSDECRRHCVFDNASPLLPLIQNADGDNFVETSRQMAQLLYDIMKDSTIPAGDIFVLVFSCRQTDYLAMLKMNYKSSYTHLREDEGINIVSARGLLPSSGSRLQEAFVVNLDNGEIALCERAYEVCGTKTNYLSSQYLQCHARLSEKSKLNIVDRAAESVANKHYGEEAPRERMEMKRVLCEELSKPDGMQISEIPTKIFPDSPSMQEEFAEKLKEAHIAEEIITAKNPVTVKKYQTQRLITDSGIEIKIPMEAYEDSEKVELITNPDGSTSVLIKNITRITAK